MKLYLAFYALELKRVFSYRVDFWVQFLVSIGVEFMVAYFLWTAIFHISGNEVMEGYTLAQILWYYLLSSFVFKISRTQDEFLVSREIYEGGLTKYIIYPLNYLYLKLIVKMSYASIVFIQVSLLYVLLPWVFTGLDASFGAYLKFCFFLLFLIPMSFYFGQIFEQVAFWTDSVWSLIVMVRFIGIFLGGAMIPLDFFPAQVSGVLEILPFSLGIYHPTQILLGKYSWVEVWQVSSLCLLWGALFAILAHWQFQRGRRVYTGVGI